MHVASNFQSTMSDATIVSIDHIQNQWLWQRYFQHKEMIHEKYKGAVNEMELFHGTWNNDPKSIYSSAWEGFDMRYLVLLVCGAVKVYIDWIVLRTILIVYVLCMSLTLGVRPPFCLS